MQALHGREITFSTLVSTVGLLGGEIVNTGFLFFKYGELELIKWIGPPICVVRGRC
jgi:hypothetical protein